MDILIDASRNRSGGAISHILGILNDRINPSVYGINKVYICSYHKLVNKIDEIVNVLTDMINIYSKQLYNVNYNWLFSFIIILYIN